MGRAFGAWAFVWPARKELEAMRSVTTLPVVVGSLMLAVGCGGGAPEPEAPSAPKAAQAEEKQDKDEVDQRAPAKEEKSDDAEGGGEESEPEEEPQPE